MWHIAHPAAELAKRNSILYEHNGKQICQRMQYVNNNERALTIQHRCGVSPTLLSVFPLFMFPCFQPAERGSQSKAYSTVILYVCVCV